MEFTALATAPARQKNACTVVAIFKDGSLSSSAGSLDKSCGGAIKRAIKRGDIQGSIGQSLVLHELNGVSAERVLLVGAGEQGKLAERQYRQLCITIGTSLTATGAALAVLHIIEDLDVEGRNVSWRCRHLAESLALATYQFDAQKSQPGKVAPALSKAILVVGKAARKEASAAVAQAVAITSGMAFARDLGNLAPNSCTPTHLAGVARKLAGEFDKLKTGIISEAQMTKLGMGAFLSVSKGSRQPAKLICMEYRGAARTRQPVVLVGKGVTFDTGGISIKPASAMDEMKYDMCGAASVFGTMRALCELKLKCNVIGVVAAAENMPDGDASRPGDVVTSMSGQTIEILNTDAEGRMVLCDTLTYIKRYKPLLVIDIATLTGACIMALGHVTSALLSNDQALADDLLAAGKTSGDLVWQLPLWEEYQSQLDSNFADMANIGGRPAGTVTAACFLSRFTRGYRWAHLDIAGTAWSSGEAKGATGRPVQLLMQYLLTHHA
jgi:leucyl aminopeptidase